MRNFTVLLSVDTRMLHHGGIGTYLRHLLPHLKNSFTLHSISCRSHIYSINEQLHLPFSIPKTDLFWSPHFNAPILPIRARKRVVTIHDVYHLDHQRRFSQLKGFSVKILIKQAISKADAIISVSEFSKQRILHFHPEAETKITVIPPGADHLINVHPQKIEGLPERFYLYVGSEKIHKNFKILLEAFSQIDLPLVIVGKITPISLKNLFFLHQVSDGELSWLYKNAEALIFPSLYEGWGLPPLEAMSLGCPVIASSFASISEACGKGALYFNPLHSHELLEQIHLLKERRRELVFEGRKRASELKWEEASQKHKDLFQRVLSK